MNLNDREKIFADAVRCARLGRIDGLRGLVEAGFDIRGQRGPEGLTFPQHVSVDGAMGEELARFLFREIGLDPMKKPRGSGSFSAFEALVSNGYFFLDTARILYLESKHKPDPGWRNHLGDTVLSVLARGENLTTPTKMIPFLVEEAGIDPESVNKEGKTAGFYIAKTYASPVIFAYWAKYVSPEATEDAMKPFLEYGLRKEAALAAKLSWFLQNPGLYAGRFNALSSPNEYKMDPSGLIVPVPPISAGVDIRVIHDVIDILAEKLDDEEKIRFARFFGRELEVWEKASPSAREFVSTVAAILASVEPEAETGVEGFPVL